MRSPHRRDVLHTLAGGLGALALAGCDDGDTQRAGPVAQRVAVIGGGMAGVATAWLLDPELPVDLFEARASIGGNVRLAEVDLDGQQVRIDTGAQYFNPRVYPTYAKLLQRQGILGADLASGAIHAATGTVTMTAAGAADPFFVSPSIPDRLWPVSEPWNQDGVTAFAALARAARALETEDAPWSLTVEDWLPTIDVDPALRESVILPWIAGINSGRLDLTRQFSARSATIFLSRAVGDGPLEQVIYYTLPAGMGDVIGQLAGECSQLTLAAGLPARGLRQTARGAEVITDMGTHGPYSAVVLALPGPMAARLLDGWTGIDAVRFALDGIETYEAKLALHRDPVYSPAEPRMRSLLNAIRTDTTCEVSMSMALALPALADGSPVDLWKSWITHREVQPAEIIATEDYTHIHGSPATVAAQETLATLQGEGGLYFAGGWMTAFDSQETALTSAMDVARALTPGSSRLAALSAEG